MQNLATGMKMAQAGAETAGQVHNSVASAGGMAPMAGAAAVAGLAGFMVSGPMVAVAGASSSSARPVVVCCSHHLGGRLHPGICCAAACIALRP
jgi:hypothetical protein